MSAMSSPVIKCNLRGRETLILVKMLRSSIGAERDGMTLPVATATIEDTKDLMSERDCKVSNSICLSTVDEFKCKSTTWSTYDLAFLTTSTTPNRFLNRLVFSSTWEVGIHFVFTLIPYKAHIYLDYLRYLAYVHIYYLYTIIIFIINFFLYIFFFYFLWRRG